MGRPKHKRYRVSDVIHKDCPNCGIDFITFNTTQKYCSAGCQKTAANKNQMQEYDLSKEAIFKRDEYKCIYCGKSSIEDGIKLHLEHVYPISKGGKEDIFNLATSCERCNLKKNAIILPEDIILRIWERNHRLNETFEPKEYEDLVKIFKENLIMRNKR